MVSAYVRGLGVLETIFAPFSFNATHARWLNTLRVCKYVISLLEAIRLNKRESLHSKL